MKENVRFYKCPVCGNIIGLIDGNIENIKCCEREMELMVANSTDAATEKHVPVCEKVGNEIVVKVGEAEHPMVEEHYIMWIHIYTTLKELHFDLKPNDEPKIIFVKEDNEEILDVLAYCNLHGLWKK